MILDQGRTINDVTDHSPRKKRGEDSEKLFKVVFSCRKMRLLAIRKSNQ